MVVLAVTTGSTLVSGSEYSLFQLATSRNKTSSIASYQHDGFIVPYEFIHVVPRDSYNSLLPV